MEQFGFGVDVSALRCREPCPVNLDGEGWLMRRDPANGHVPGSARSICMKGTTSSASYRPSRSMAWAVISDVVVGTWVSP